MPRHKNHAADRFPTKGLKWPFDFSVRGVKKADIIEIAHGMSPDYLSAAKIKKVENQLSGDRGAAIRNRSPSVSYR